METAIVVPTFAGASMCMGSVLYITGWVTVLVLLDVLGCFLCIYFNLSQWHLWDNAEVCLPFFCRCWGSVCLCYCVYCVYRIIKSRYMCCTQCVCMCGITQVCVCMCFRCLRRLRISSGGYLRSAPVKEALQTPALYRDSCRLLNMIFSYLLHRWTNATQGIQITNSFIFKVCG